MINCQDCVRALNPYIDRELTDEDLVHVRQHLDACGGCLHLYQFEESVRRLVRVRCQQQAAPNALRDKISMSLAVERMRLQRRGQRQRPGSRPN